jgi:hypothetical protein
MKSKNIRKISPRGLEILKNLKAFTIMPLPEKISDEVYDEIAAVVRSIGGTWSERHQAFCFNYDPSRKLQEIVNTGVFFLTEESLWREKRQFYPTPADVVKSMVMMAEISEEHIVLEPSAGHGAILDLLPNKNNIVAVEIDKRNLAELKAKGYNPIWKDFLKVSGLLVDRVVMNPPFSNFQDVKHVCHALDMLKVGGILVAVINENTLYRSEHPDCKPYMERIMAYKPEIIILDEGTFAESDTMIRTAILKIKKEF